MSGPFQIFAPLDEATESALRESIRRFGVLVPVSVDGAGRILDGHHRSRIAEELGVKCPKHTVYVGGDVDEAREIARTLNADRRHLTVEQRREVVAHLRAQGHSVRSISGALGVPRSTIADDVSGSGHLPPAEIKGTDGKTYPATRPTPAPPAPADVLIVDGQTGEVLNDTPAATPAPTEDTRRPLPPPLPNTPEQDQRRADTEHRRHLRQRFEDFAFSIAVLESRCGHDDFRAEFITDWDTHPDLRPDLPRDRDMRAHRLNAAAQYLHALAAEWSTP